MRLNFYHSFVISSMCAALTADLTQGKSLLHQIKSTNSKYDIQQYPTLVAAQQEATLELQAILAEVAAYNASDIASDVEKPVGQSTTEDDGEGDPSEPDDSDEEQSVPHRCVPRQPLQATEDDITEEFRKLEGKSKELPFMAKPSTNSQPGAKTVTECETNRIIVLSK